MLHGSPSPGGAGSELTVLLAQLAQRAYPAEASAPGHRPLFAERLGQWLSWSGAISLSSALNAAAQGPGSGRALLSGDEPADYRRVRAALLAQIAAGPREPRSSPTDFGPYRRHCLALQQAMQDAVGALRQRLRQALSARSAQGARLAAIDAVMDQTLAAQERGLLGLVPLRLQAHFERLQHMAAAAADPSATAAPDDWHQAFREDMDRVLRAELTHRLLPAQGLLDTLRQDTSS